MLEPKDSMLQRQDKSASGACRTVCRSGALALALSVIAAADLPRVPFMELDLGATPALAKNDRSADRGGKDRGPGHERRQARSDGQDSGEGRRIWNRPGRHDHADNGRHLGQGRSLVPAANTERRKSVTMATPVPLPPRHPDSGGNGFRNHGDRVSTFVALSKAIGLNASTGAKQANFGTPFENELVARDPVTGEFLRDPVTGKYVIDATEAEIAAVKPGNGPKTGWETVTDLDVNFDGVVDRADLDLALAGRPPTDGDGDNDNGGGDQQANIVRPFRSDGERAP